MPIATLSSRERVVRALEHKEPDRVPLDLSLTVGIYHRLREYLGLPPDPDKSTSVWTVVSPQIDLLDAMGVDILSTGMNPPANCPAQQERDGLLYDEWGVGRIKVTGHEGGYYLEMVKHPLANASLEDVEGYSWPDPYDEGRIGGLRERIGRLRRDTDKAILMRFSNSIWDQSSWLYGMESWLIDTATRPEVPAAIMDRVCDVAVRLMTIGLEEVGDLVDIVRLSGEDFGTQQGPMISPHMFEELVRPRFSRLWSTAKHLISKKNPKAKLMLHSCGSVRAFLPMWIQMGLDILNPIQPRAKDMEPEGLKRDFGEQVTFHGGIDIQRTLPYGSAEEVMAEVRQVIRTLAPGGGYIVSPSHNVQGDVPPANLVALRDAVEEYGYYPIQSN